MLTKEERKKKNNELKERIRKLREEAPGIKCSEIGAKLGITESRVRSLLMEEIDRRILKKHVEDQDATISKSMAEFEVSEKHIVNLLTRAAGNGFTVHF